MSRASTEYLGLDNEFNVEIDEVITSNVGNMALVTLNRPKALNSLNLNMINKMIKKYKEWEQDPNISSILVRGTGKAFSAGADIRLIAESLPDNSICDELFYKEYNLNNLIYNFSKCNIAIIDGIVMGGGAGISINGQYVIATEKTIFAMPEVKIGFIPDVGSSYFLPKLPYNYGYYLGLTGNSICALDVKKCGLATHYISSEKIPILLNKIKDLKLNCYKELPRLLKSFEDYSPILPDNFQSIYEEYSTIINRCFGKKSIEQIIEQLEQENSKFAEDTIKSLKSVCPLSLKAELELLNRAKDLDFSDCLKMEYMRNPSFKEGVRAQIIDKDKKPKWIPQNLDEVTEKMVTDLFEPMEGVFQLEFE